MMKRLIIVLLLASVFTGLCAAQSQLRNFHQEGPASQEINTQELTASHPSLPLGTQVRVTNPRNGKQTTVRITGRIPATEGRIVDLSRGAASALELSDQGRSPVVLEIVPARRGAPTPVAEAPPPPPPPPEEPKEEPPPPEEPKAEPPPEEPPPDEPRPTEEQPLLPPHEDPSREMAVAPETPYVYPAPETEYIPGADPQAPSVNTTDTKNQTTAPVSAQSPNITIYNVLQSPNSFATDSAPVNAEGGAGQAPITAAAPTASISRSDQTSNNTTSNPSTTTNTRSTTLPPAPASQENNKPATATATAQIVVPQAAQPAVQPQPVQPPQPAQQPVQPRQSVQPTQPQPTQPVQPTQPQPTQPVQPRQPEPSPLPPIVDRGTALIKPFMPNADSGKVYRVQVGSYQNTWHAREAFDRLTTVGFKPAFETYGDYIRVVIPGVPAADMPSVARLLGRVGFTEALIREEN